MFRSGGSLRATAIAATLPALLAVAACSSDPDPASVSRAAFGEAMQERYGIGDEQAACITAYVFEDYDEAEITVLADEGMPELPQARWEPYLNATVACITHDEPLDEGP